ncbi:MAG: gamma-glutamyltransferase [Candidatus Aminicenantaceae bacterium]
MSKRLQSLLLIVLAAVLACETERPLAPPEDPHVPYDFTARKGMVVAAHPLAAQAGLEILERGGNAIDAAVATALALNAAEPFASGIGGGGFMVLYLAKENRVTVINFREKAPAASFPEMFHQDGEINLQRRRTHGLAVAVPGALAGWTHALAAYGTLTLAEVVGGAIRIAEQGYEVSSTFSKANKDEYEKLLQNDGEDSLYLNHGFPFESGDSFRNPELARFLQRLAERGAEDFYSGETASRIVEAVQAAGGVMTLEDLAAYQPQEYIPLSGSYGEYTLYSTLPPSCGGLHILQLLGIAQSWPLQEWGHNSPDYIHHMTEAFRFVFADKARYLGDPDFVSIPVGQLISPEHAQAVASRIRPGHTAGRYPSGEYGPEDGVDQNTTHLCVVDKEGNIVSLTQSINHFFGSGIVPAETGFLLNNHMDDFADDPCSPNAPGPHKRPVSNMGPLLLFREGRPYLALGSPGGTRIFPSLTQILLNVTVFGMSLDEAIEAPRFFSYSNLGKAGELHLEDRIPEGTRAALKKMGHSLVIKEAFDRYFGGAQGLMLLPDKGLILGGADSRRDGYGAGY